MATFPDISPNYGASKKAEPTVRIAQFGSGYSQRTVFGINNDKKIWDLSWRNRSAADANTLARRRSCAPRIAPWAPKKNVAARIRVARD